MVSQERPKHRSQTDAHALFTNRSQTNNLNIKHMRSRNLHKQPLTNVLFPLNTVQINITSIMSITITITITTISTFTITTSIPRRPGSGGRSLLDGKAYIYIYYSIQFWYYIYIYIYIYYNYSIQFFLYYIYALSIMQVAPTPCLEQLQAKAG